MQGKIENVRNSLAIAIVLSSLAVPLAGCAKEPARTARDGWVRLAAVPGRPAAGYVTLHGGPQDATLVAVSTNVAVRTEMHESMRAQNGMMTMDAIPSIRIPANTDVAFAPGGKHLMLFGINPITKPGGRVTFTLTFADGVRIDAPARVVAAGDPAPDF